MNSSLVMSMSMRVYVSILVSNVHVNTHPHMDALGKRMPKLWLSCAAPHMDVLGERMSKLWLSCPAPPHGRAWKAPVQTVSLMSPSAP